MSPPTSTLPPSSTSPSAPLVSRPRSIIVIGAGIIGLQTALTILLAERDYNMTIVAEHFPGDENVPAGEYTSPWAGAVWRTMASPSEPELCAWDTEAYRTWMGMSEEEKKEAGVGVYRTRNYWDVPTTEIENGVSSLWWSSLVLDFSALAPDELPNGVHAGVSYTTVTLNVPSYLDFILKKIKAYGGRLVRKRLPDDGGLIVALAAARNAATVGEEDVFAYVNATGISARKLVPDNKVFPVRGQTVLVKGEAKVLRTRIQDRSGKIKYVITRSGSGTTILGGTREDGVWDTTASAETSEAILSGCKDLIPELLNANGVFEVLSSQVGLRPARQGGPRVEVQVLEDKTLIVHSYGHAGAGYQNSIGSANKVLQLLEALKHRREPQARL